QGPLPAPRGAPVRGVRLGRAPRAHHHQRVPRAPLGPPRSPAVPGSDTHLTNAKERTRMATTAHPNAPLRLSSRTSHFVLPKQWASMRKAEALERDTGRRVIHFEKGDFQGDEFRPAPHIMEACAKALRDGYTRYVPGPGLPELRDAIAEEATKRGRPTARE